MPQVCSQVGCIAEGVRIPGCALPPEGEAQAPISSAGQSESMHRYGTCLQHLRPTGANVRDLLGPSVLGRHVRLSKIN